MSTTSGDDDQVSDERPSNAIDFLGHILTPQDAADFMNEVSRGDQACPVCQETNWEMNMGAGDGSFPVLPSATTKNGGLVNPDKPTRFPVFGVVCANCGYTRLHGLHHLVAWKKEKEQ